MSTSNNPDGRAWEYPWDTWYDGKWRRLRRGEHFSCLTRSMTNRIHHHGKRYGYIAETRQEGKDALRFRFLIKPLDDEVTA